MASLEEVKGGASKKRKDGSKGGLSITDYSELLAVTDKTKNQKKKEEKHSLKPYLESCVISIIRGYIQAIT